MGNLRNRAAGQVLVLLATLAFLMVSTLALAHGHTGARSAGESHCAMCMAVHSATHVVGAPTVELCITAVEGPLCIPPKSFQVSFVWLSLNQYRAPPSPLSLRALTQ
jgi:hypothetical protein